MDETVLPPSPTWFLPNILSSREDGSICYGSKNNIVILKPVTSKTFDTSIIKDAHEQKITSVAFSHVKDNESLQNTIASCSEDGFVKLWKIDTLSGVIGHKSHWDAKESCGRIVCLDWSTANPYSIVSAAENSTLVLWDILSNTTQKFLFQKILATTISCCPHNEKLVAVGVKSGLIYVVKLVGSGDVVYKLRGHDNEIQALSWCPAPFNVFRTDNIFEEFLLASTCQNREVYIWRAGTDGKCETKIQIPTSSISKKSGDPNYFKSGKSFSFLPVFWHDAYTLYLSSSFGELLKFDIQLFISKDLRSGDAKSNAKQTLQCFKLSHHHHFKGLFAITSKTLYDGITLYGDVEIKSALKFKLDVDHNVRRKGRDESDGGLKWRVDTPASPCLLWTAGQDRKLVACKFNDSSELEMVYNVHTLNGSVYSAVVSPHDPNRLAIAAGDGVIRLWNLQQPSGEIQIYWQKIKDRVMSLAWHPTKDGLLAYGTSVGRVGLIDTNSNKMPKVFKPSHPNPIYGLCWGPAFPESSGNVSKQEYSLYCVGDNTLSLYTCSNVTADPLNLTKLMPFPCKKHTDISWKPDYSVMAVGSEDGSIYLVEPTEFKIVHTLLAYKKMIQSIAWHPLSTSVDIGLSPYHTYFTAASTDNDMTIKVFNYAREGDDVTVKQVASLKGHYGHIQHVSWCPHLRASLMSTSVDGSVQIWDVTTETPQVNFKPIEMPLFAMWMPTSPDFALTGSRNSVLTVWRIAGQSRKTPAPMAKPKKLKKGNKGIQMSVAQDGGGSGEPEKDEEVVAMAEVKSSGKNVKEIKMLSKAWRDSPNGEFDTCYNILKRPGNVSDDDLPFSLPFLSGGDEYKDLIASEEDAHRRANNWTECYELALWNGRLKETIEEKMKAGQLNDFLVSLAPTVSPRLWQEACLAYSKSLTEKKSYRKAATYLTAVHRIYDAVELLATHNLYLEALCLARCRLPGSDPVVADVVRRYGEWLFQNGSYLKACECYSYLGDYMQVAKILGKKSQAEYLSLAALAARKCGSVELEIAEATNALLKCLKSNNFALARRICDDHDNLKHLRLMFYMFETMHGLDVGKLSLERDIIAHVRGLIGSEPLVFPDTVPHLYQKCSFYKTKQEMFVVVAQELSLAVCENSPDNVLEHVIKALSTCSRYVQGSDTDVDPLFKLCTWLSPSGSTTEPEGYFGPGLESNLEKRADSAREFLGAAIVRHLNSNPTPENVAKRMCTLNSLRNSFLNETSFRYFKNLIEVEVCERRLVSGQVGVLSTSTHPGGMTNGGNHRNVHDEPGEEIASDQTQESDFVKVEKDDDGDNSQPENSGLTLKCSNGVGKSSVEEGGDNLNSDFERCNGHFQDGEGGKDSVVRDRQLLSRLRGEIEEFEKTRVSVPNPVPVFYMLKKLCDAVPESETAGNLARDLEKKWLELN